ncbi:MAG: hypothetical protein Q9160_003956 [Pyrenula sp. 1 TL-2023]
MPLPKYATAKAITQLDYTDRWALARTCSSYHSIGLPLAFELLRYVPLVGEPFEDVLPTREYTRLNSKPDNVLHHVKHVEFAFPDRPNFFSRHAYLLEEQTAFEDVSDLGASSVNIRERFGSGDNPVMKRILSDITKQTLDILAAIPEGRLESFRQKKLKKLSIDTGLGCVFASLDDLTDDQTSGRLDTNSFDRLTSISWKGGQSVIQWTALRNLIALNHFHLRNLSVDTSSNGLPDMSPNHDLLIHVGLELPSLRSISLRRMQLDYVTLGSEELSLKVINSTSIVLSHAEPSKEQLRNFDMSLRCLRVPQLKSLRLIGCNEVDGFLERLLVNQRLSLKRLEIADAEENEYDLIEGPDNLSLPEVLRRCDCLEEMYLLLHRLPAIDTPGGRDQTQVTWDILNTQDIPLRRLVYHERTLEDEDLDSPADWVDYLDRQLMKKALSKMELECFGICDLPHLMPHYLDAFRGKSTLKVIHIRRSYGGNDCREIREEIRQAITGYEWFDPGRFDPVDEHRRFIGRPHPKEGPSELLTNLVRCLFGGSGIESLELVAYGDFSNERKFRSETLLYVRAPEDPLGYREIAGVDPEWEKVREPWKDFLSACPFSSGREEDSDLEDEEDSAVDDEDDDEEDFDSDSQFPSDDDDGWTDTDESDDPSGFSDNDSRFDYGAGNEDDEGPVDPDATDDYFCLRNLFAEVESFRG